LTDAAFHLEFDRPVHIGRWIAQEPKIFQNIARLHSDRRCWWKQKEVSEINAKYDEDKRRYLELTGAKPKAAAPAKK
jgi:hypothetical protein